METPTQEELQFKVSSALKSIIGRDLVTNDFVAIFELVKNSADAGASEVNLIFSTNQSNKRIFIVDNGKGMSRQDILNKWLIVAYSAKHDGTEDSRAKTYAGNKGIGRFSCDRLGATLTLQTKATGEENVQILKVDWGKFEESSKNWFTDISINLHQSKDFELPNEIRNLNTGVIIEISNLRNPESWDRNKLLSLKQSLTKLIDPFGDKESILNINLHVASELKADDKLIEKGEENPTLVNGPIHNSVLDILNSKTTKLKVNLIDGYLYSTLTDRSELIYKIREKLDETSHLKDTKFSSQIYYLNRSAKQTFSKRMGISSVKFGSLFLFRNGFRVFPIGEETDDFWGLGRRKQQGHSRYLGSRDILGKVEIYGPETKFKEASSRDLGLIKTNASEELKKIVTDKIIKKLESYVVDVTWKDILDKDYANTERMHLDQNRAGIINLITKLSDSKSIDLIEYNKDIVSVLNEKSSHFESTISKLSQIADSEKNSELFKLIKEAQSKYEEEKRRTLEAKQKADEEIEARKLAEKNAQVELLKRIESEKAQKSLKTELETEKKRNLFLTISESRDKEQLESFIHQLIIYASASKDLLNDEIISISNSKIDIKKDDIINLLSELLENNEKIITTSRFATTAAFMLDSAQIEDDLPLYIEQYINKITTAYHRKIEVLCKDYNGKFTTRFSPIEIGMILDNLVANSQKARSTKVVFTLSKEDKDILKIDIRDNGRGFSSKIKDTSRIFEKGYTTTDGSGLGLFHVKKQLENFGGEISIPEEQPDRGARFLIRIKK